MSSPQMTRMLGFLLPGLLAFAMVSLRWRCSAAITTLIRGAGQRPLPNGLTRSGRLPQLRFSCARGAIFPAAPGRSEHAVLVRRVLGDRLADVPKLYDPMVLEAKDMDDGGAAIIRVLANVRMHRHEALVLENVLHFEDLAGI